MAGRSRIGRFFLWGAVAVALLAAVSGLSLLMLPGWIQKWLGGDDFRRLASRQLSSLLRTEGDLQPLQWSSFSISSAGFSSRPDAPGVWRWELENIRTGISPRLLLDRILRFPEISVESLRLLPGARPGVALSPESTTSPATATGSPDLFREVQVGSVEIGSLRVDPGVATSGWGGKGIRISAQPTKTRTDFQLRGGEILNPLTWLGPLQLQAAEGHYTPPTLFLNSLQVSSPQGGSLRLSGEYTAGSSPRAQAKVTWENWSIPGGKIGVGLFEIPARMSGDFVLQELRPGGPVGQGQVRLVGARLEPGRDSQTILSLLGVLTGDTRLQKGAPLTTAQAQWSMQPGLYNVNRIVAEAPGLLRVNGQIRVQGSSLSGQILLGLEQGLGSKVNALTGGECFRRAEGGYAYETVNLSGTLERPQNDLQAKLTAALTRTAVRTGIDILQKATGNTDPSTPAGAAGQVLKSIFGAPPGR